MRQLVHEQTAERRVRVVTTLGVVTRHVHSRRGGGGGVLSFMAAKGRLSRASDACGEGAEGYKLFLSDENDDRIQGRA